MLSETCIDSAKAAVYVENADYATTQGASSGTVVSSILIGISFGGGVYDIFRRLLIFTNTLPVNAVISSAKVKVYSSYKDGSGYSVVIQRDPNRVCPHSPVVGGDYNKTNYAGNGGSIAVGSITTKWNEIDLDISWVVIGGVTRLILRTSMDIAETESTGMVGFQINNDDYEARLELKYTIPDDWRPNGGTDEGELVWAEREYKEYARKNLNKFKSSAGLFELPYQGDIRKKARKVAEWRKLKFTRY